MNAANSKRGMRDTGGIVCCIALALIVAAMGLQGCGGVSTQEDSAVTAARIAGGGLRVAVDIAAPQYAAPLRALAATSLAALGGQVDLGAMLGDVMALVTEISQSPGVDKYAQSIADVGHMFSGLIRLNWDVPTEYARAVAIARAFFEAVAGV